jgi:hypothetical protein
MERSRKKGLFVGYMNGRLVVSAEKTDSNFA